MKGFDFMGNYSEEVEVWKDIPEYEGLYQISNLGRVKSLHRVVRYGERFHTVPEKLKKITIKSRGKQSGGGYSIVGLYKNNIGTNYYVHRLVAENFIPNKGAKETVNHKDGNKQNNHFDNLEWATYAENNHHAAETGLVSYDNRKNEQSKSISVHQYDSNWQKIGSFPSMREAGRQTDCDSTQIGKCCRNRNKTCGGFHWSFG